MYVKDSEQELLALQNTFDKLAKQMRQAAFRVNKYSREAKKNLELFLRDFIERHLKLLVSSTVTPNVKELLLFKCLLDVVDVSDENTNPTAIRESAFSRLQQMQQNYLDAKTPLQKDALYCTDIYSLLEELLIRIESLYKGVTVGTNAPPSQVKDEFDDDDKIETEAGDDIKYDENGDNGNDAVKTGNNGQVEDDSITQPQESDPEIERILNARYATGVLGVNSEDDRPYTAEEIETSGYIKKYRDRVHL